MSWLIPSTKTPLTVFLEAALYISRLLSHVDLYLVRHKSVRQYYLCPLRSGVQAGHPGGSPGRLSRVSLLGSGSAHGARHPRRQRSYIFLVFRLKQRENIIFRAYLRLRLHYKCQARSNTWLQDTRYLIGLSRCGGVPMSVRYGQALSLAWLLAASP